MFLFPVGKKARPPRSLSWAAAVHGRLFARYPVVATPPNLHCRACITAWDKCSAGVYGDGFLLAKFHGKVFFCRDSNAKRPSEFWPRFRMGNKEFGLTDAYDRLRIFLKSQVTPGFELYPTAGTALEFAVLVRGRSNFRRWQLGRFGR